MIFDSTVVSRERLSSDANEWTGFSLSRAAETFTFRVPASEEADSQNGVAQPFRSESSIDMSEGMTSRRLPTNTSARNPTYPMGHPARTVSSDARRHRFSIRSLGLRFGDRSRRRLIHPRAHRQPSRNSANLQARKAASIGAFDFRLPLGTGDKYIRVAKAVNKKTGKK